MSGSAVPARQGPGADERREELLRLVYRELRAPLLRSVRTLTGGDADWAEDVFQETALRAWQHAADLRHDRPALRAWLMTVARRIVIDDRRQRGTRPTEVESDRIEAPPVPDGSEAALSAMVIAQVLPAIPPHHREVVVLTYLRDLPLPEVAALLGIPPGTVKSRLHYGLRALRDALDGDTA